MTVMNVEVMPDAAGAAGLAGELRRLEREARRIEAEILAVITRAEASGEYTVDGHRTVGAWCQSVVKWSLAETRARVRAARVVAEEPDVAARLTAGDLGVGQVRLLGTARANPRCGHELTDVIPLLLQVEPRLHYDGFKQVLQRWEQLADRDGAHRDSERAHERRGLWCRTVGHTTFLRGQYGSAQGALLRELLAGFEQAEFAADVDAARAASGVDDPPAACLARTAAQRAADALLAAFTQAASAPADGGTPGASPSPTVNIVIDEQTFLEALQQLLTGTTPAPGPIDPTWRRCETLDGHPLDPLDVAVAALVGHVRRVVINQQGTVIDLGRRSRLFTGAAREAVWLRENTCLWPGCGCRHCQVDHLTPWPNGGHTNPHNGGPACGHHNRWKHLYGYRTWRDQDGTWHLQRPDGTEIRPI